MPFNYIWIELSVGPGNAEGVTEPHYQQFKMQLDRKELLHDVTGLWEATDIIVFSEQEPTQPYLWHMSN